MACHIGLAPCTGFQRIEQTNKSVKSMQNNTLLNVIFSRTFAVNLDCETKTKNTQCVRGISQGTCKVIQTFIIHRVLNVGLAILITQLLCVDKTPSPEYLCIQQNSHCLDSFKHSRMSATLYVLGLYVKSLTQKIILTKKKINFKLFQFFAAYHTLS